MKKRFVSWICAFAFIIAVIPTVSLASEYDTGIINADGVAFRDAASSEGEKLKKLSKGTVVQVVSTNVNAEWDKVKYNGETGYVNRIYVSLTKNGDAVCDATVVNVDESVNVRDLPSKDGKVIGKAKKGEVFSVTATDLVDGWYGVEFGGERGYISSQYLQVTQKASKKQLSSLSVSGGTLSPSFSPDTYGYVVQADKSEVKISCSANSGVKVSVGYTGKKSCTIKMPKTGSKTVRISVGGKTRYSLYIVRGVVTVGTWNIKRGNGNLTEMGQVVAEQQPDILGLQEVYCAKGSVDNLLSLRTKEMKNKDFVETIPYGSSASYGIGLLSKYEILSHECQKLYSADLEQRYLQKIVVSIRGHKVSVYNTHFSWDSADIRAEQFKAVKKVMDKDKNRYKILFGDFNAKSEEFYVFGSDYEVVNKSSTVFYDYDETSIKKNCIDNIIVSKNITVCNARMINVDYSDHKPLFAYLKIG